MRPRLLSARPCVTRRSRQDPRSAALESVAAEFALLAQRRTRIARQIDLLGRQLDAASSSLHAVQSRMGMLAARIDHIDPSLRQSIEMPPAPPPVVAPPPRAAPPRIASPAHVEPTPTRPNPPAHLLRPMRRRRPFLPD